MTKIINQSNKTEDLMRLLMENGDIEKYIENAKSFSDMLKINDFLLMLLRQTNMKKARVIEKAGIDRIYGYEIFRGKKVPRRDTLLRILLTMQIEINDIQHILKNTGYPILYPKNIRDAVIIHGIMNSLDVDSLNMLLYDFGHKII